MVGEAGVDASCVRPGITVRSAGHDGLKFPLMWVQGCEL